jgi:hypothetical protein
MSILDKAIAALTPPESDEARAEARAKAAAEAGHGTWFAIALEHHEMLRAAFATTRQAPDAGAQAAALKELGALLLGHAQAEEAVLYPAPAAADEKAHAELGYNEQAMVKMEMALLEKLPPLSQEFADKLQHIEGAVLHHMYEEEGTWFIDLKNKGEDQAMLTQRFQEEFTRYMNLDRAPVPGPGQRRPPAGKRGPVPGLGRPLPPAGDNNQRSSTFTESGMISGGPACERSAALRPFLDHRDRRTTGGLVVTCTVRLVYRSSDHPADASCSPDVGGSGTDLL